LARGFLNAETNTEYKQFLGVMELKSAVLSSRLKVDVLLVCRNCDLPMDYEGENPKNYLLFRCYGCGNRTGVLIHKQ